MKIVSLSRFACIITLMTTSLFAAGVDKKGFDMGGDFRWRNEWYKFVPMADGAQWDDQSYYRIRTRLWMQYAGEHATFYVRFGNEWRHYIAPDNKPNRTFPSELFIDNLYVDFSEIWGGDWDLRIGRQDFTFGSQYLTMDPTGMDGSTSGYFNGLTLTHRLSEKTTARYFALYNDARWNPVLGHAKGTDEHFNIFSPFGGDDYYDAAIGAYFTHEHSEELTSEYYVIGKMQGDDEAAVPFTHSKRNPGEGLKMVTGGTRVLAQLTDALRVDWEIAAQAGRIDDGRTLLAMMNVGRFTYALSKQGSWSPELLAMYVYASGGNSKNRSYDWRDNFAGAMDESEVMIITASTIYGCGTWSNTFFPSIGFRVSRDEGPSVELSTGPLFAATADRCGGGDETHSMGWLGRAIFNCPIAKGMFETDNGPRGSLDWRMMIDVLNPGDYFKEDDLALFAQTQLLFTY